MNMVPTLTPAEEALGAALPSRRDEEWKWTDLKRLINRPYTAIDAPSAKTVDALIKSSPLANVAAERVVIVNGVYDAKRSKLTSHMIASKAPAIAIEDALISINSKLNAATVSLTFSGNIDTPVEILRVSSGDGAAIAGRLHIDVEAGASATLIETFVGDGDYLHNPVTTITIAKGGRLDRVKVETESAKAQHLSHIIVSLAERAIFNDFTFTSGATLSRQNGNVIFRGEHANVRVSGSYLLGQKQHVDTRLVVDHTVPHCTSRELFKCVMNDQSRGIFQGKVIVRPDAQKTDGKQSSHALLLSESAEFDAKPELEIYADDVVCGHGSTCGDLNHDYVFYLMSRGIPEATARAMLVEAFIDEAVETVENETIREALIAMVHERMAG
jgi:Fe-S cluster assembly protein SufD